MESSSFDGLVKRLGNSLGRRSVLGLAAGLPLGLLVAEGEAAKKKRQKGGAGAEKKKKKGKSKTYCLNGQTVSSKKKKQQKKYVSQGATPGACPTPGTTCTPNCPAGGCGMTNGCGGTCTCSSGSSCQAGVCAPCSVQCAGSAAACGTALQTALNGGGDVIVCPGRYGGQFTITQATNVIGSGNGTDPATSTILDGQAGGTVVTVTAPTGDVAFTGLRVTNGSAGGVAATGGNGFLFVVSSVIDSNTGAGGIVSDLPVIMSESRITNNTNANAGGGLRLNCEPTRTNTVSGSTISGNTASSGNGGGIYVTDASLSVTATTISGNTAPDGAGIYVGHEAGPPDQPNSLTVNASSSVTGNNATSGGATGVGVDSFATTNNISGAVSGNTKNGNPAPGQQCGGNATC
ncbi:MAG: right-handed parallel beta-helix repeat-containing protein [Thermomicrobiales bacterium]